ncbi:diguanylate cyclase (GGDEF)-like protein/PAS domain S-box-containing protein [Variovorax sp. OAS795]
MNSPGLRNIHFSLNTRLGLGVAAVVLAATLAIATIALQLVKTSMKASIESEAFARLSAIANTVDQKFVSRRTLLETFAASAASNDFPDPAALQAFLERHAALRKAFSNVAFFAADGDLLASLSGAQQPGRVNIKDRRYFQETVGSGASVISEPYVNRLTGLAQIAMTAAVPDATGNVKYVISGAIDLQDRSILGELADVKFGQSGYLFITTADGVLIDHPRMERVLGQAGAKAAGNPEIERPIEGYEGATEGVNPAGVHGLYAFKRLRETNWVMGSMYPSAEAFGRLNAIERSAWLGALVLAMLAGALALGLVRRQLMPLTHLHRHMLDADNPALERAMPRTYARDEIGDIARTFDTLMSQRKSSEKFLRDITDNLPAMVSHVDAQGRFTFVNAPLCKKLDRGAAQLIGREARSFGEDDEAMTAAIERVQAGEAVSFERRGEASRGEQERYFQTELIPDRDKAGNVRGYYAMTSDVTERKRIEFSLAHSEAQVRIIADNIPALVSHVDASLRYTFVNAQVRALHKERAMVGRRMPEVRGAADYSIVAPAYERALAGETVVIEKAGDPALGIGARTFKAHYIPDQDANGAVQGVFAMTFDITDEVNIRKALTAQEKRLRDLTDAIPALVGHFDSEENCHFANSRARRMAGLGDGPLDGVTLRTAVGREVYRQQRPYLPLVREGKSVRFQVQAPLYGKPGYFQVNLIPDKDAEGKVIGFYMMTFNVTALKTAELRQAESEMRLRTITDNLPALITYIDRDEKITFANATYREWMGVDPARLLGRHVGEVAGEELYLSRKPMIARALAGERVEFEAKTRTRDIDRTTRVSYVPDIGPDGTTRGIFSLSLDITALKTVERQLMELARLDTLTGLANRLAFNEYLPVALARAQRSGHALAVLFLDIDYFKTINDTFGHATGDGVLVEYARRLLASVRSTDTVARLAGDEFVVVLEDVQTREAAAGVARKIVGEINTGAFAIGGRTFQVTTSIGIAFHQPSTAPVSDADLLARADAALYRAKSAGRNTFGFSD